MIDYIDDITPEMIDRVCEANLAVIRSQPGYGKIDKPSKHADGDGKLSKRELRRRLYRDRIFDDAR